MRFLDRVGHRYGRLQVLERASNKGKKVAWLCACDCGNKIITSFNAAKLTQSCGCIRRERFYRDYGNRPAETDPAILLARKQRKVRQDRDRWLKEQYGMSLADVENMKQEQNGLCAICGIEEATDLDHNHTTGRIRALLCHGCNAALGLVKERIATLKQAITYLELYE